MLASMCKVNKWVKISMVVVEEKERKRGREEERKRGREEERKRGREEERKRGRDPRYQSHIEKSSHTT